MAIRSYNANTSEYQENDSTGGNYIDEYLENTNIVIDVDNTGGNYIDEYLENTNTDETGGNYIDEYLENVDEYLENIDTIIQDSGVENVVNTTGNHNNDPLDNSINWSSIIYDSDNGYGGNISYDISFNPYNISFNPYEINEENTPEPIDDIEDILIHLQNLEQENDSGYESNDDVDI